MSHPRFLVITLLLAGHCLSTDAKETQPDKAALEKAKTEAAFKDVTQGALRIVAEDATIVECPLQHTDVQADIAGFIARVRVTQTFRNPTKEKIEAVYVFPLPHQAAIDEMTMVVGERRVVGVIKRRNHAREIYEQAIASGQTASLLEQERPNIFTQSVGNIAPGQEINIEISYVDVLKYDQGTYEFDFPMVVGPRYNPQPSPGQPAVADAGKINPPVLRPGTRTSHDISLTVNLDAGVPIQNLKNSNHDVHTKPHGTSKARLRLLQKDSIPNKDFVLRYEVVGGKPEMAVLAHTGQYSGDAKHVGAGYFMLMIQPKENESLKKSPPREIVFMVDVSGSMRGKPTEKTREAMKEMLTLCRKQDTLQVVTFASQANKLFDAPVPINEENVKRALEFTNNLRGSGGTRMLEGVKMAIDQPIDKERTRIVVMLTDGKIGNEAEIVRHIGENCGDQIRFWCVGIGSSPNMFLVDGVARQGGGMGKKLGLNDDTVALTTEIITRIQRAQLANIKIDWGELEIAETFPAKIPELWAGRPVVVFGRYKNGGEAEIKISGTTEGEHTSWPLSVSLPNEQKENDVLAKTWARRKIEDLMHQSYYQGSPAVEEEVTAIALDHRLMSQYTSFVAVDTKDAAKVGEPVRRPRRMVVPVPLPEGTQWEGFFGGDGIAVDRGGAVVSADRRHVRVTPLALSSDVSKKNADYGLQSRISMYENAYRMQSEIPQVLREYNKPLASVSLGLQQQRVQEQIKSLERLVRMQKGIRDQTIGGSSMRDSHPAGGSSGLALARTGWAYQPYSWNRTPEALKKYVEHVKATLVSAKQLAEESKFEEARAMLTLAYFLDTPLRQLGRSVARNSAIEALHEIRRGEVSRFVKAMPALSKKLDLVIRDQSLTDVLTLVCKQAKLDVNIVKGSVEDAKSLTRSANRITFLDLRRVTVVEALEWITNPAHLMWSVNGNKVKVFSARRGSVESPWIYDVSMIAIPPTEELKQLKEPEKLNETLTKMSDEFIGAVRSTLKLADQSVVWFSGNQLMVVGDAATHAKVDDLLRNLADPSYKPGKELAQLHKRCSARATSRHESAKQARLAERQAHVASVHQQFSWPLLSAASRGDLDLEALTELQITWKDTASVELLTGKSGLLMLRSLWTVCEASRLLPDETELVALANEIKRIAREPAKETVVKFSGSQHQPDALAIFYAALVFNDPDGEFVKRARMVQQSEHRWTANLAEVLFGNGVPDEGLFFEKMTGEDAVLLSALACRRADGDAYNKFRSQSRRILGQQPLNGHVVVLVNRLATPFPSVQ